jgi:hypothetical protein
MPSHDLVTRSSDYVVQNRSRYTLEHFVIGQHDTPAQRYRQILIEAQRLESDINIVEINLKIARVKIKRLEAKGDEISLLKAEKKRVGMAMTELTLEGARRELAILVELFEQYEEFDQSDIEDDQPDYWAKRLQRQAETDQVSRITGVSTGNIEALLQSGDWESFVRKPPTLLELAEAPEDARSITT